jgi:uncharacterized phage-associated protein
MALRFREDKATQAAARLLRARGGSMHYLKLLKLLYLADRKALLELGRPISYDRFVSMPHGPVLSRTYDLIVGEPDPEQPSYWHQVISEPEGYKVALVGQAPRDQLSRAEEEILDQVFAQFGHWGRWRLAHYTHTLPEYRDPQGSSLPIEIRDVLLGQGVSPEDATAIWDELVADSIVEQSATSG